MNKTHVMRGLILKDWYGLRSYLVRQVGLVLAMYVVLGFVLKSMSMLPAMMVMVTMMGMLSAFSLDDTCHWNGYACTMNITARQLARARYALYYGTMACVARFPPCLPTCWSFCCLQMAKAGQSCSLRALAAARPSCLSIR